MPEFQEKDDREAASRKSSRRIWLAAVALYAIAGAVVWNCETLRMSHFSIEEAKKQAEENKKKNEARRKESARKVAEDKAKEIIPPKEIEKIGKSLAKKKAKQIDREIEKVDEVIEKIDERLEKLSAEYKKKRSPEEEMRARVAAVARAMARFDGGNPKIKKMAADSAWLEKNDARDNADGCRKVYEKLNHDNQAYAADDLPRVRPAVNQGRMKWLHKEMARLLADALKQDYGKAQEFPPVPLETVERPGGEDLGALEDYVASKEDELDHKFAAMEVLEAALKEDTAVDSQLGDDVLDSFAADEIAEAQAAEAALGKADPKRFEQLARSAEHAAGQAAQSAKSGVLAEKQKNAIAGKREKQAAGLAEKVEKAEKEGKPVSADDRRLLTDLQKQAAAARAQAENAKKEKENAASAAAQAQSAARMVKDAQTRGDIASAEQYAAIAQTAMKDAKDAEKSAWSGKPRAQAEDSGTPGGLSQMAQQSAAAAAQAAAQARDAAARAAENAQQAAQNGAAGVQAAAQNAQNAAAQAQAAAQAARTAAGQGDAVAAAQAAGQAQAAAAAAGQAAGKTSGGTLPNSRESLRNFSGQFNELANSAASLASKADSMARQASLPLGAGHGDTEASRLSTSIARQQALAGAAKNSGTNNARGAKTILDVSAMMRMAAGAAGNNAGGDNGEGAAFTSGGGEFKGDVGAADPRKMALSIKRKELARHLESGRIISNSVPGRRVSRDSLRKGWLYLDAWYMIGPWDAKGIPTAELPIQAPEKHIDLDGVYNGKPDPQTGKPIKLKWRYVQNDAVCLRVIDKLEDAYYYAYTDVWFAEGMDMNIVVGSDDAAKVWINGMVVWDDEGLSEWNLAEGVARVYFKKGWNKILIRIHNGPNECQFSFCMAPPLLTKEKPAGKRK